jgi:hypothetical protein
MASGECTALNIIDLRSNDYFLLTQPSLTSGVYLVRYTASSAAESPPPTTATGLPLKRGLAPGGSEQKTGGSVC